MSSPYVQLRHGALEEALDQSQGRRHGSWLAAAYIAIALLGESKYPSGNIDSYEVVKWSTDHGLTWRRNRRALVHLQDRRLLDLTVHPFRAGSVQLNRQVLEPHDRALDRYTQLRVPSLLAIAKEHTLGWVAVATLALLSTLVHTRTWQLREDTTLEQLSADWGIGRRSLRAGLAQLAAAGLIRYEPRRGHHLVLEYLAGPALIEPPAAKAARLGRKERRKQDRELARTDGPADGVARRLVAHHQVPLTPSPALVDALRQALVTGAPESMIWARLVARGGLSGVHSPMGALVARAQQLAKELEAETQAAQERRERSQQEAARQRKAEDAEEATAAAAAEEGIWLASVMDDDLLALAAQARGRAGGVPLPPAVLAGQLLTAAKAAVAARPDLTPAEAVCTGLLTDLPLAPLQPLPQARTGPTLAARLRSRQQL